MPKTITVEVCNLAGGDSLLTRWRRSSDGATWVPSRRAVKHFLRVVGGSWGDVRPLTDTLGTDRAMRIMRRCADEMAERDYRAWEERQ